MVTKVLHALVLSCGVMAQLDIEGHKQLLQKQNTTLSKPTSVKPLEKFEVFSVLGDAPSIKENKNVDSEKQKKSSNVIKSKEKPQERNYVLNTAKDADDQTNIMYSTKYSISLKKSDEQIDRNGQVAQYHPSLSQHGSQTQAGTNVLQYQPLQENLTPMIPYSPSYYQSNHQVPLYTNMQPLPANPSLTYPAYQNSIQDHQLQGSVHIPFHQNIPQPYPTSYYAPQEYRTEQMPFGQLYPQNEYLTPVEYDEDINNNDISQQYRGPAYENTKKSEDSEIVDEDSAENRGLSGVAGHLGGLGHKGHGGLIAPGHLPYGGPLQHGVPLGYRGHLSPYGIGGHIGHRYHAIGHKIIPHGHHHKHANQHTHKHNHIDEHDHKHDEEHNHVHANQHTHKHNHIDEHDHKHDEEHNHVHRHTHHHDHHHNHKHRSEHEG